MTRHTHLAALAALTLSACTSEHNVGNSPRGLGSMRWAVSLGGPGWDLPASVATDSLGNVYATGKCEGAADFGSGELQTAGLESSWVTKRAALDGSEEWTIVLGREASEYVQVAGLVVDNDDNVILTGTFRGSKDFGGVTLETPGQDTFAAKYSANGNLLWARGLGGTSQSDAWSVAVGDDDRIYISGTYQGVLYTADRVLVADGIDAFIAGLDSDGMQRWVRSIDHMTPFDLAVAHDGEVIAVTGTSQRLVLDGTELTPVADSSQALARLTPDGNVVWARIRGDVGVPIGGGRVLAISDDRLLVANRSPLLDGENGVSVLDAEGNELWSALSNGSLQMEGMAELSSGAVVMSGQITAASTGSAATFLRTFDDAGTLMQDQVFGDRFTSEISQTTIRRVAPSNNGGLALAGTIGYAADFGTGPLPWKGLSDIVIGVVDPEE